MEVRPDGTHVIVAGKGAAEAAPADDVDAMIARLPSWRRRNPFAGVTTKPDRHGKLRHRLRRIVKGRKLDTYLPGPYGSPAFRAAHEAALVE